MANFDFTGERVLIRRQWCVAAFSLLLLSLLCLLAAGSRHRYRAALIVGDSMAPALQGLHYRIECGQCGFPIEGGWQHPPDRGRVVCPNCGFRENELADSHSRQADRVRIVPLANTGILQRGDVIAFHTPGDDALAVKRVMALPGETPSVRTGDLYVDGRPIQKSLAELERVAILVHDNRYRPPTDVVASGWQPTPGSTLRYHNDQSATLHGEMIYRHRPPSTIANPLLTSDSSAPVRDFDAYNQSLSRQLFVVTDLLLSGEFRLAAGEQAAFYLEVSDELGLVLNVAGSKATIVWQLAGQITRQEIAGISPRSWHCFSLALCDGRLLLGLDAATFASPTLHDVDTGSASSFRMVGSELSLRNLRISRDIYYLHPLQTNDPWQLGRPLADDEFLVLGDNSPASTDSRHWQQGIRAADILGKVFPGKE